MSEYAFKCGWNMRVKEQAACESFLKTADAFLDSDAKAFERLSYEPSVIKDMENNQILYRMVLKAKMDIQHLRDVLSYHALFSKAKN